ncbi:MULTISPECIES: zinc-binding dehydrogenase [Roseovarius]|uniref:zinc-binding dehydrogenase n=1 Tax=Roseovarius TaxID=74030 RepID=UPI001C966BC5|nr:zinc-binding dehydrogenase [Roseovarius atlanticus]MBY5989440.1 alcohol dehydrogenase catalytic domain-containing protein [Roseovarius atlanticus]MBY6124832.1 alcohol dehydrogenase catalytic domain-containing protein [Roseovarius atlanticus]MBY6149327.1 alcohol dehydrogenase catalytic domain-containing protein [Roseovarius atlanticus]
MKTIKAAVCHAFGTPLVIEDVRLRAPEQNEVEVALETVAICHSDISYADGAWGGSLPAVYGHEAAGRISAIGDGVTGLAVGDPVVVTLIRACGQCPSCGAGRPTGCETPFDGDHGALSTADGGTLHQAMACGAFATDVVVHHSQVVKIPEGMAMDAASLLACGVVTGVGAVVNAAQLRAGQDVVVIGAGGVGLNAIQGARIAGARRIVAVDMTEDKLADAKAFGATDGVLASQDKPWRAAKQAMGRGADAVLVTVGAARAYDEAPRYIAGGGKVIMVGMPATGAESTYEAANFAAAGQSMVGSKMGDVVIRRDIPWMVDLYQQGRLKLDELISNRWTLDQINDAIADTKSGTARRNVIMLR